MSENLDDLLASGGILMYPVLLLGCLSAPASVALYVVGLVAKEKRWALRFAVTNLVLGIGTPLAAWSYASWQSARALGAAKATASPEDWATLEAAARSELFALPWAALLSSPWFLVSGFGLLGVALLRHPALAASGQRP